MKEQEKQSLEVMNKQFDERHSQGIELSNPKTLRELRDFLNQVDDRFLDRNFSIQRENDIHHVHGFELNDKSLYYDPEDWDLGSMSLEDWTEYYPETDHSTLKIGIPIGAPLFYEEF